MFSKFVNFAPIDLEIGTHIDPTHTMYLAKNALIKITCVSMTTKYPIFKHRAFLKIFCISTNNEDIGQKFLLDNYDLKNA